jgi:hypothetical protein
MANAPQTDVVFSGGCPDSGRRVVRGLPPALPDVGDDFDWLTRDYDGFRMFMMEELAARMPERKRWTPADLEVVLVEGLAAVLDQLSDMADRLASEAYLETARQPATVRRLLQFAGFDPVRTAFAAKQIMTDPGVDPVGAAAELEKAWLSSPWMMETVRAEGPREIRQQERMVTADDHGQQLELHPLVRRAGGVAQWGGAWPVVRVAVLPVLDRTLDARDTDLPIPPPPFGPDLQAAVNAFHVAHGVAVPTWTSDTTVRTVLTPFVDRYRMIGAPVTLQDAVRVGIVLALTVRVSDSFFQSEVRDAVLQALGTGPGAFFEPGRLGFGETLHLSEILRALLTLDGVDTVCVNRFKRVGPGWLDQVATGSIPLHGVEFASCENDSTRPDRGYIRLELQGGKRG